MKIYIVLTGEAHEGGSVEGVYMQREDAIKMALFVKTYFPGGWQLETERQADAEDHDIRVWTNGCDWVSVEEHEVCP